jgi:hypothetical protein
VDEEERERFVVDEMILRLSMYAGPWAPLSDLILGWLREGRYLYFDNEEIRRRARRRLEMLGVSCYVVFGFDHYGPGNHAIIKEGSTVRNPEARAYAHFISSSPNPSNIIGAFGADYVATARFGLIVLRSKPLVVRTMDRCLNPIIRPILARPEYLAVA